MDDARASSTAAALPLIARSLSTSSLASRRTPPSLSPRKHAAAVPAAQRRHSGPGPATATATATALGASRCSRCLYDFAQHQQRQAMTLRTVKRDELLCSICFDILCFPVTLPCGHNFDRGCILAAWRYDQPAPETQQIALRTNPPRDSPAVAAEDTANANEPGGATQHRRRLHLCPLCRQEAGICNVNALQVNLLLKDLIAGLYPLETECAATLEKKQWAARVVALPPAHRGGGGADFAAGNTRAPYSFRAVSSFAYVCVASLTDPPGFVLAVLLLMGLIAIACNPQPVFANNASAATLTIFDVMEHVFNGFSLLIREFSLTLDQLEQLKPWIHAFSFIL